MKATCRLHCYLSDCILEVPLLVKKNIVSHGLRPRDEIALFIFRS
jgi:hypothetical protein